MFEAKISDFFRQIKEEAMLFKIIKIPIQIYYPKQEV